MKKISLTAFVMIIILSFFCTSINALAYEWEERTNCQDTITCANGEVHYDIYTTAGDEENEICVVYGGEGIVTDWEFPLSKEGVDYEIVSVESQSITLKLLNQSKSLQYINAIVDFNSSLSSAQESHRLKGSAIDDAQASNQIDVNLTSQQSENSDLINSMGKENKPFLTDNNIKSIVIICVMAVAIVAVFAVAFKMGKASKADNTKGRKVS